MGQVVTVMNMKGGVGKTTVTMNVGGLLGRHSIDGKVRRILLIDYDPQFNLSQTFIRAKTYFELDGARKTALAILQDDDTVLDPYRLQVPGNQTPPAVADLAFHYHNGAHSCIHIVPSTLDLMYIALGQSEVKTKPMEERFHKFIADARHSYDVVFIDCHPAGSILTKTSLQTSDHVLIPVIPQRFALRGVGLMMQFIKAKQPGTAGPTPHVLLNSTSLGGMSREEQEIRLHRDVADCYMKNSLRYYKAFGDPLDGDGFVWTSRKPWSGRAYNNLHAVTEEFVSRAGI